MLCEGDDNEYASVVPSLDGAVETIREAAGADFAFVLTRRGRLVTRNAPKDMPESGRKQLIYAADRLAQRGQSLTHVSLPREDLVPFGGAAPVDVYVAVQDEAVICLVLASWTDPCQVGPAVEAGLPEVADILSKSPKGRGRRPPKTGVVPVAKKRRTAPPSSPDPGPVHSSSPPASPSSRPPTALLVGKGAMAGLVQLSGTVAGKRGWGTVVSAAKVMQEPPQIQSTSDLPPPPGGTWRGLESVPDIFIGTAPLGRESIEAIEADQALLAESAGARSSGSQYGSLPEIALGVAALGRASMSAIELDAHGGVPRGDPQSSMPDVRVTLASMPSFEDDELRLARDAMVPGGEAARDPQSRLTQPWTESAADTKRAIDAARGARGQAAPKVSVRLASLDEETAIAMFDDEDVAPPESGEKRSALTRASQDSGTRLATGRESDDAEEVLDEEIEEILEVDEAEDLEQALPMAVGSRVSPVPDAPLVHGRRKHRSLDVWRDAIEKILDDEGSRSGPGAPTARDSGGDKPKLKR